MSLTERKIPRRKFIVESSKRAGVLLAFSTITSLTAGCFLAEKRSGTDDEIIDVNNMSQKLLEAFSRAINYPLLEVEIPTVEAYTDVENLPKYAQEETTLAKFGLKSISFAQDSEKYGILFIVDFLTNVGIGKPFTKSATPYPAFIVYGEESVYKPEPATSYLFTGETDNPKSNLKSLLVLFPVSKGQLSGKEFIIVFNHNFLNVNGFELPSFTLPFRFQFEKAEPFARTN